MLCLSKLILDVNRTVSIFEYYITKVGEMMSFNKSGFLSQYALLTSVFEALTKSPTLLTLLDKQFVLV